MEYSELEGTHTDHQVQLLTPHRATWKLNHLLQSVVQTLLVRESWKKLKVLWIVGWWKHKTSLTHN